MNNIVKFKHIACPSCSNSNWNVSFGNNRLILDCADEECRYRLSIVAEDTVLQNNQMMKYMPLQYDLDSKVVD